MLPTCSGLGYWAIALAILEVQTDSWNEPASSGLWHNDCNSCARPMLQQDVATTYKCGLGPCGMAPEGAYTSYFRTRVPKSTPGTVLEPDSPSRPYTGSNANPQSALGIPVPVVNLTCRRGALLMGFAVRSSWNNP